MAAGSTLPAPKGIPANRSTALVTGAARGIGLATAQRLAETGLSVVGLDLAAPTLPSTPVATPPGGVGSITWATCDVRSPEELSRTIHDIESDVGAIHILVSCAGVQRLKPLDEATDVEIDLTIATNLRGTINAIRAVLPGMKRRGSGHIVNVSSVSGLRGYADDAVYCATKFGVAGLTESLDEELRPFGIRLTSIFPGATDTELVRWVDAASPYRRHFLRPSDVANAILYAINQPPHVAVGTIVLRPFVEPPYSQMLPLDVIDSLRAISDAELAG